MTAVALSWVVLPLVLVTACSRPATGPDGALAAAAAVLTGIVR